MASSSLPSFAPISTYAINLKERTDRFIHIKSQFIDKPEFNLQVIEGIRHESGYMGIWQTIIDIIELAQQRNEEFILICEDDHEFTADYKKQVLFDSIADAWSLQADIICGGICALRSAIPVSNSLYWTETFSCFQFTILFNRFFSKIQNCEFRKGMVNDHTISDLSTNKYFIYPFISRQREFGYSDATQGNEREGRISKAFDRSSDTARCLIETLEHYRRTPADAPLQFEDIILPTYIINLPERKDRREHIIRQFNGKKEFDVTIIEACRNNIGAVGLWLSIRKIIEKAIDNDDDLVIICEDDHEFTDHYTPNKLLKNIIESHIQGADLLSGGIGGGFTHALRISSERFWINHFFCTQFIVIYKKFYQKILDEPFDLSVTADNLLSELTSNKMVLFPFISIQRDFGYSDVTDGHNVTPGLITSRFKGGEDRLSLQN